MPKNANLKRRLGYSLAALMIVAYPTSTAFLFAEFKETQHHLQQAQTVISNVTRESANTRVKTVAQRCDLTKLVLSVLVRQDRQAAGPFQRSYNKCRAQAAEVAAIAARAQSGRN